MKLPRWLVVCMLNISALSVLGVAACWWVTWPERTIAEVERNMVARDYAALKKMIEPAIIYQPDPTGTATPWIITQPKQPRSAADFLLAVRRMGSYPHADVWLAKRGQIVLGMSCTECH